MVLPFGVEPLEPAYGRDYATVAKAFEAFDQSKDFATSLHGYTNKRELAKRHPEVAEVRLRFNKRLTTAMAKLHGPNQGRVGTCGKCGSEIQEGDEFWDRKLCEMCAER